MVHLFQSEEHNQPHAAVSIQADARQSFQLTYHGEALLIDGTAIALHQNGAALPPAQAIESTLLCNRTWENLQIFAADCAAGYPDAVEKAIRVWILDLPHQMVTVDIVKTKEDCTLCTNFNVNNLDDTLNIHEYSQQRLVFRRGGQGFKLFELLSLTDGVPVSATLNHAQVGPIVGYSWEDLPGKAHLRVHTYSMDTSENIPQWHVKLLENNAIRMEYPRAEDWWDILPEPHQITLIRKDGKQEVIKL